MTISSVGTPATPPNTTSGTVVTGTWGSGQNRTAPNLLVALVTASGSLSCGPTAQNTGTTGWTKVAEANQGASTDAVWTKPATGGDAAPSFSCSSLGGTTDMSISLFELTDSGGSTPAVDTSGTAIGSGTSPLTTTTGQNVTGGGEYALGLMSQGKSTTATLAGWGSSSGWTNLFIDGTSLRWHWNVSIQAAPASGAPLSYAPTFSNTPATCDTTAGVVAVFKAGTPAVSESAMLVM